MTALIACAFDLLRTIGWHEPLTPFGLVKLLASVLCFVMVGRWLWSRWLLWNGLEQWPTPDGRYYERWLSLNDVGDYYEWLANQKGGAEPWASWARNEMELTRRGR